MRSMIKTAAGISKPFTTASRALSSSNVRKRRDAENRHKKRLYLFIVRKLR